MSVTAEVSEDGRSLTIKVKGQFDFSAHEAFRAAYEQGGTDSTRYVLDLAMTEDMDSSALGMLLMLREHASGTGAEVRITNCREATRNVLAVAGFQKLFRIDA